MTCWLPLLAALLGWQLYFTCRYPDEQWDALTFQYFDTLEDKVLTFVMWVWLVALAALSAKFINYYLMP